VSEIQWLRAVQEGELFGTASALVEGERVALFKTEEGIFALDDICSHEYSRLSEGEVEEGQVACAKHGSRFDLRSGAVTGFPATRPVRAWPAKAEGGWIWVSRPRG
jgi:3-phenylpropionate/trans-cinnamate dioxygenase ferredoxin component